METNVIKGKPVADKITENLIDEVESLKNKGINPNLAIVRVGENPDDMSYERGAMNRCAKIGIDVKNIILKSDVSEEDYINAIEDLNNDKSINGILCLRPLPKHIDENRVKYAIDAEKDVDCFNPINSAKLFEGDTGGYAPCTPEAVMKILKHYNVELSGKRAVVLGRSLIVGKPVSMMLMGENATVTVCHSKTENLSDEAKKADVLIAAIGRAKMVDNSYVKEGATVIDVGINVDECGNLCGDVDTESVLGIASMVTPVPAGVGSVTTSVLAEHVIRACKKQNNI
ncbi:bifunctional 5,10-methylenetetrahydrofolate dehydrogenase/5,10-methenyltetrahydrofolate cyclohydrolase [Peptacetobacter hiranonis]|uniref:Bifunctional protein FolD n=1 Tax=Peptacetobacter hiranonis (strain DSM 13275 / JCM 10541 / KCTC 15199 / TO-931) TaxID=500633 RepID=B6G129_PEPHT|nr:bifunctional 5,10-methylenetetrahydrofolate dehydrogenase/5,10-methenyltetrahydrofolate cyclohydrolase [Peptacetobacter hiranonis]EEA84604.1 tetrahydrofolate dehydrogenase/cyclohydrolase, NAD(P)-binding domain protein [Peptacetobacter hiranonis DSM 13275]QEK21577.1 Bifunctional protein FolD protein [Peptacetobacter hiranonis]